MGLLVDFLFYGRESQVEFDHGVYRTVITALGGREAFINIVYETIDPEIKALKGQIITTGLYVIIPSLLSRLD